MIGVHKATMVPPAGGAAVDVSCWVDAIEIRHGRSETTAQPEAASATLDVDMGTPLPVGLLDVGSRVTVTTDIGGGHVLTRFVGEVTDIALGWDDAGEQTPRSGIGQVVAVGGLGDLGRVVVGDVPWPQELDGARVQRVLVLAGYPWNPVKDDPGTCQILARDIDSQDALSVIYDAADSAGGVLWHERNGTVHYADADHRRGIASVLTLDACDVLVTPAWARSVQGLINKVTVSYGVAPAGGEQPTTSGDNVVSIGRYGTYAYSVSSTLAALADAQRMVSLLTARNAYPVWLMTALPVAVADLDDAETLALLSLEVNDLMTLTGLPTVGDTPTTAALWVEGWTERLAWDEHEIELTVSGFCRTVPAPSWDAVSPSWTWDTMGALTWDAAICIGPPLQLGRWADVAASERWDLVPVAVTWNTWDSYVGS